MAKKINLKMPAGADPKTITLVNRLNNMTEGQLRQHVAKMETKLNGYTSFMSFASRSNGWQNLATGLGVRGADKRKGANLTYRWLTEVEAEILYAGDKLGRRIIELLPEEALREWITFHGFDPKVHKTILDDLDNLDLRNKLWQAWTFARIYGGSGIWVMVDDGVDDMMQPLVVENVKKVIGLWVFSRFELQTLAPDIESAVDNPNFGRANYYMLVPRNRIDQNVQMDQGVTKFHHTRVIRFNGAQLPRRLFISNQYWDDSILTSVKESLQDYKLAVKAVAGMVQDYRIAIFKMKGLADAIASGNEDLVGKRLQAVVLSRSTIGATMIDGENEEYKYEVASLENIDKMIDIVKHDLQGCTEYPAEILFNDSPSGGLGEGAGDNVTRRWYDRVASVQKNYAGRPLNRFFDIYLKAKQSPVAGKPPDNWSYTWNNLYKLTDKEISEARKADSEADQNRINSGVLTPEIILSSRFGGDSYGTEIVLPEGYMEAMKAGTFPTPSEEKNKREGKDKDGNPIVEDTPTGTKPGVESNKQPSTSSPVADGEVRTGNSPAQKLMTQMWMQDSALGALEIQEVIVSKSTAPKIGEAVPLAGDLIEGFVNAEETSEKFRFTIKDPGIFDVQSLTTKQVKPGLWVVIGKLKE